MRLPSLRTIREWPLTRRVAALAAVVLVHALLLLLLLRAAPDFVPFGGPRGTPLTVDLLPAEHEQEQSSQAQKQPRRQQQQRQVHEVANARATPTAAPQAPAEAPSKVSGVWSQLLQLNSEDYAKSDVSKLPKAVRPDSSGGGAGSGSGEGYAGASDQPVGSMGNGEPLYAARWLREPTHAELSTYFPAGKQGYGTIACKTAPRFKVEDCEELEQFPPGSGMAHAAKEAAWQFLVVPPRIGGKPQIGVWVRIQIEMELRDAPK